MVTFSDASGPDLRTQGAELVGVAETKISSGATARFNLLSWRSAKIKRVVASTLAGETLALSSAVAELEWIQLLLRDVVIGDIEFGKWQTYLSPFLAVIKDDSQLK